MPIWFWLLLFWVIFDGVLFLSEKMGWLKFSNEIAKYSFYAPVLIPVFIVLLPVAGVMRLYFKIKYRIDQKRRLKRKK